MPGILPMKIIKVGSSSQSRVAQACDRCRSKKIRCDGVRPCCSQCAGVGFECKISDKLSRRAFPRGYTESLEERVRVLETELRELRDGLDDGGDKLDAVSNLRSNSTPITPQTLQGQLPRRVMESPGEDGDVFQVYEASRLIRCSGTDPCFAGASSGLTFLDALRRKLEGSGRACGEIKVQTLFAKARRPTDSPPSSPKSVPRPSAPPRLVGDRLINIYFREWAPLFPLLHRPTFLDAYEKFCTGPDSIGDDKSTAQVFLVFGLAGLSCDRTFLQDKTMQERPWQKALDDVSLEETMSTLQCLGLAHIYCLAVGDYEKVLRYWSISVGLSHRLGLHHGQSRFSLDSTIVETRRKVFWCIYTLDCFSAATLGLPRLFQDRDVHVEFPADQGDEGQPLQPHEPLTTSSALAVFEASRLLAKVLERLYPQASSYELSRQDQHTLEEELQSWLDSLAPHLKLPFVQGNPAAEVTSSSCLALSLIHQYIHTLIHRPALCSTSPSQATSSVDIVADCAKRVVQLVRQLEERKMSFALCLNKTDLLLWSGFALLFQAADFDQYGRSLEEQRCLVNGIIGMVGRDGGTGVQELMRVASYVMPEPGPLKSPQHARLDLTMLPPPQKDKPDTKPRSAQGRLQSFASRFYRPRPRSQSKQELARRRSTASRTSPKRSNTTPPTHPGILTMQTEPIYLHYQQPHPAYYAPYNPAQRISPSTEPPTLNQLSFNTEPVLQQQSMPRADISPRTRSDGGFPAWDPTPPSMVTDTVSTYSGGGGFHEIHPTPPPPPDVMGGKVSPLVPPASSKAATWSPPSGLWSAAESMHAVHAMQQPPVPVLSFSVGSATSAASVVVDDMSAGVSASAGPGPDLVLAQNELYRTWSPASAGGEGFVFEGFERSFGF